MWWARRSLAAAGIVAGLTYTPHVARTENQPSNSWLSWLLYKPIGSVQHSTTELHPVQQLERKPGNLLIWGGAFGKSPRRIQGVGENVIKAAAGDGYGVAVDKDGKAHGFTLRDGEDVVEPIQTPGTVTDVAVRDSAREIVMVDSSGRLLTSRLVDGGSFEPAKVLEGAFNRVSVSRVRCGKEHCVAVTKWGAAYSWGSSNSHGQLGSGIVGDPEGSDPNVPGEVRLPEGVKVHDAACGNKHTMYVGKNGALFGVGNDRWAQLGISAEPWLKTHEISNGVVRKSELVSDLAVREVAAGGGDHSVMLVRDGTVFTFGFNQWGQLGHHNYSTLAPPSPIADYTIRALAISAGANHTCIVKENGEMWCIGGNDEGQLGTGNLQPSMVWKKVRIAKRAIKPSFIYLSGNTSLAVVPSESASDS